VFEKEHKHVLRDIRELGCSEKFSKSNFERVEYRDAKGERRPEYLMTRDGFVLLAMSYTGEMAMRFKEAYIQEFSRIESEIQSRYKISALRTLKDALLLAARLEEERETLESRNKVMIPDTEFYDTQVGNFTAIEISKVSRVLYFRNMGKNKLFAFLRDVRILMRDNVPYQEYIDRGYFRIIEQRYQTQDGETHISLKTLVYQTGVDFIRRKLIDAGYTPLDELERDEESGVRDVEKNV
jgi:anti-repressor protein